MLSSWTYKSDCQTVETRGQWPQRLTREIDFRSLGLKRCIGRDVRTFAESPMPVNMDVEWIAPQHGFTIGLLEFTNGKQAGWNYSSKLISTFSLTGFDWQLST